jgi:RimJ/RimL family protein N-acetyltransferase
MRLRKLTEEDAAELSRAVTESLAHLRPWAPWAANGYNEETAAAFLREAAEEWELGAAFPHAITVGGAIVGVATVMRREGDLAEIGYWLHPGHTGRGHVTAATAELVGFAFALDGVDRVQIWHDEANVASSGVPRRLGFTRIDRRTPPREAPIGSRAGVDVVWELRRPASRGQ